MNIPLHGKYKWLPILYHLVDTLEPKKIVELGPATGLTTITMAQSLKENNINGHINSYDIWNNAYWGTKENCSKTIMEWEVQNYISLWHLNFYDWIEENEEFDFLYFDIDNNGENLLELYEIVKDKIDNGSVIAFEGGSVERDKYIKDKTTMNEVKDTVGYTVLTPDIKYSFSVIYNRDMYELETTVNK